MTTKRNNYSAAAVRHLARQGKDVGKPGKNFNKIANSAAKEYGSAEAGKRVAGAIFQKMLHNGKL